MTMTPDTTPAGQWPPVTTRPEARARAAALRVHASTEARNRAADAHQERTIRAQRERDERARRRRLDKEYRSRQRRERWTARTAAVTGLVRTTVASPDFAELAFYAVVATVALIGQAQAATRWLHWNPIPATVAVAAIELGGVVLMARADVRRRLGERALPAVVLSAAVAAFAVAVNLLGHRGTQGDLTLAGWFFAGMSALGYAVYLIRSASRRRDARRAAGQLGTPAPDYGIWQWLTHPAITRRARQLHARDPQLGLYGSIDAAQIDLHAEAQRRRLARLVRDQFRKSLGSRWAAKIATASYDLDRVAAQLRERADYDGLVDVLAGHLAPERLAKAGDGEEADGGVEPVSGAPLAEPALFVPDTWPGSVPTQRVDSGSSATLTVDRDRVDDVDTNTVDTDQAVNPPVSTQEVDSVDPSGPGNIEASTRPNSEVDTSTPPVDTNPPGNREDAAKVDAENAAHAVLEGGGSKSDAARAYMRVMEDRDLDWSATEVARIVGMSRALVYRVADR